MLLEALIGILIFSLGILGIISFQATATKMTSDARYRTEAVALADELVARATGSAKATLAADFSSPNGAQFKDWRDNRLLASSTGLPGGTATVIASTDASSGTTTLNISISWTAPGQITDTTSSGKQTSAISGTYNTYALVY